MERFAYAGSFAEGSPLNIGFSRISVFIPIAEFETSHSLCLLYMHLVVVANGSVCGFHRIGFGCAELWHLVKTFASVVLLYPDPGWVFTASGVL